MHGERNTCEASTLSMFIRAIEPRITTDLLLPLQKQLEIIKPYGLPATWLLQYDALVSGPLVPFLKQ
jgi:hypothetical protein